jgi:hypothetical protein
MSQEEKKKLRYVIAFEKGSLLIGSSTKRKRDLVKILPIYRKQWKNAVIEKRLIDVPRYTKEEKDKSLKKLGKSDRIGNSDRIGKSDRIGNSDSIGNLDLSFKRVRGRREFFDEVLNYIKKEKQVALIKLEAYFQYTTGASSTSIHQALAVLENIGLIESEEVNGGTQESDIVYKEK